MSNESESKLHRKILKECQPLQNILQTPFEMFKKVLKAEFMLKTLNLMDK